MWDTFQLRDDQIEVERRQAIGSRKTTTRTEHSTKFQKHLAEVKGKRGEERRKIRRDALAVFVDQLPAAGESLHLVFDGDVDAFDMIPHCIGLAGAPADELYLVSWAISRPCCLELLELIDGRKAEGVAFIVDPSFRDKRASIYATALEGLLDRGQRMRTTRTHAKVTLMRVGSFFLTMETSANLNANKRIEQMTVTNHRGLYEFHRDWMEEILNA